MSGDFEATIDLYDDEQTHEGSDDVSSDGSEQDTLEMAQFLARITIDSMEVRNPGGEGGHHVNSEEHRKKLVQQQQRLLLLRHASKCPHESGRCPVTPHCWSMKQLWRHVMSCKDQECKVPHCVSSRYVLSHYSKCNEPTCPVCGPVREAIKRNYKLNERQERREGPKRRERNRSGVVKHHMRLLTHSASCENCESKNCARMKKYFKHDVVCMLKVAGGCRLCARISNLLNIHARECRNPECKVPRCRYTI
mmetsp:Transcript_27695/g.46514  ORF Transcript_27695/g.46514 Transcript_27695/m.46514 type:complete len:251 (+) Transcript_27695:49-801(+)